MRFRKDKETRELIKQNKRLIKEFPFLLPRNRFTDKKMKNFDYTWTELDNLASGWKDSFGLELCENLKRLLVKANFLKKYRIIDIKEKYGTLRLYSNGVPEEISDEYETLINYYEDKSQLVCHICGKPSKYVTDGWIEYLCEEHLENKLEKSPNLSYLELTWKDVPTRIFYHVESNTTTKKESDLKGEMMCTWKRHSKHNKSMKKDNVTAEDSKEDSIKIKTNYLWKQE